MKMNLAEIRNKGVVMLFFEFSMEKYASPEHCSGPFRLASEEPAA
jgi:hypothetical protein